MRLRWLQASNTALVLASLTLGPIWSGSAFAQEEVPADAGVATPPPSTAPRVEVAKLLDDEEAEEAAGDLNPEEIASGVATPPPDGPRVEAAELVDGETDDTPVEGLESGMATPPSETTPEPEASLYGSDTAPDAQQKGVPPGFALLQLDVKINGAPTGYISAFYQREDGALASTRGELEQLRIAVSGTGPADQVVLLQDLPTATYSYNETEQSIDIRIDANQRVLQDIQTREQREAAEAISGNGVLLNYTLFSAINSDYGIKNPSVTGISSQLESRAFTKWGTLEMSGIIASPDFEVAETTRLNTTLYIDDPKRMLEYQLGDVISGGTNWSRPVRLGGGQVRRNFAMRPDLITMPLPEVSGTAGVPSTVDVYVGGVRAYAGEIGEGPFRAQNIPVLTDQGTVRVVLTDAIGREVEAEGEFFTSPDLLRPGLVDFSLEGGFLREGFGKESFDYSEYPVAVASLRYGLTHILTAEAHSEVSEDLQNGGIGLLMAVPYAGTFNVAAAGSLYQGDSGLLFYGSWEKRWGDVMLSAATSRTIGDYQDLASVDAFQVTGKLDGGIPKAIDQLTVGYSIPEYEANATVNFVHALARDDTRDLILSGTVSKSYGHINLVGSSFVNFGDDEEYGLSVGFSMPLGRTMTASGGATATNSGFELGGGVSKAHSDEKYSTAWTVNYDRNKQHRASGKGELRMPAGTANADVELRENGVGGSLAYSGSAVATKGGVLFGRHVGDSFAIVDAGAPNVRVRHENQYAGSTGKNGQLLVNNIASYTSNKFDIDLDSLALTAETPETEKYVIPRRRSGVVVDFKVTSETKSAIVKIEDAAGAPIPVSTEIALEGNPEPFVMGYDGEVYVTGLSEKNIMTVSLPAGACKVEFAYTGDAQNQEFIGPLKCV